METVILQIQARGVDRYYAFAARFGALIVITILGYAGRSGQMEILPGIFQHFCALGLQEIVS